ncbi:hypothetical protein [Streptomyces sp. NPDC050738]|uniref:hypothetical protein n=1 Tax=Streptomyces sp. NPDC050738 TaxID=3154744 RepID=UPI003447E2BC
MRHEVPGLVIERLVVTHAGDDNVYFLGAEPVLDRVQLDTAPGGQPPFLVEGDDRVVAASEIAETVAAVRLWLGSGDVRSGDDFA